FVEAISTTPPAIEWTAIRRAGGIDVTARNSGDAHAHVFSFSIAPLATPDDPVLAQTAAYILPDQARTWSLDIPQTDGTSGNDWRRLRVKGASEAGDFELEISPGDGRWCASGVHRRVVCGCSCTVGSWRVGDLPAIDRRNHRQRSSGRSDA